MAWQTEYTMRRFFYGVKVCLLITKDGIPGSFGPESKNGTQALKKIPFDLTPESEIKNLFLRKKYCNF